MSEGALRTATLPDGSLLQVIREKENKVVGRIEVYCIVTHVEKGTPSRKDVRAALAKLYGKSEDLVVIKYIKSEYGIGRSKVRANIYNDLERLKAFEPDYLPKRGA